MTRAKPPTGTSAAGTGGKRRGPPPGAPKPPEPPPVWPEDENTVIELDPFVDALNEVPREDPQLRTHDPPPPDPFDAVTPVDPPFCHECGKIVVLDDFTDVALHAYPSHCLRARNGTWWWCSKLRKSVTYVPE